MSVNNEIKEYLESKQQQAFNYFVNNHHIHAILVTLFEELNSIDKEAYHQRLLNEIESNCQNWWTNVEQGINPVEELYCIYFEYDYLLVEDPEATAYGIKEWGAADVYTECFGMGHHIEFATEFYANPGITLSLFSPLQILDWSKRPAELKEMLNKHMIDVFDLEGFNELYNSYLFMNHLILCNVLVEFGKTEIFKSLNTKEGFQFHIGEHDTGEVYPLWTKE